MYKLSRLKNGINVVTKHFPGRKSVAVGVWVKVGARYESFKTSGISHFIEHMLFKGTKKRSARKIKQTIEGLGGQFNAFTSEESTCYFVKILSKHFPLALDVLADMVNNSAFSPAQIEKERTVILEEVKMYKDLPSYYVHEMMHMLLWPKHVLGKGILGTEKSISGLKRGDFLSYLKRFYHPKNIYVIVTGDIEHRKAVEEVERNFPRTDKGPRSSFKSADVRQIRPASDILTKQTEQTHFVVGTRGLPRTSGERYKLSVLNIIAGGNMSSRLYEEVREKRGLAYEIRSNLSFYQDTGVFSVSAGVDNGKVLKSLDLVLKELDKFRRKKVNEKELERAKEFFLGQLSLMVEDTLNYMLWIGEKVMYMNWVPDFNEIRKKISEVTREDIQELAKNLFKNSNLNLALIGPADEKAKSKLKKRLRF